MYDLKLKMFQKIKKDQAINLVDILKGVITFTDAGSPPVIIQSQ
jgi:hypothetical protein